MASANETFLRPQLLDRRVRLERALAGGAGDPELVSLLASVDAALDRMDDGTFGLCRTCHDAVEPERLLADPLVEFCLDHLSTAERRALEEDLERAARIQRGLLPEPHISTVGWEVSFRYLPAGPVSGDYCDIVTDTEDGGGVLCMLGDISGKGVAAALLMSQIRTIFRGLLGAGRSVDDLVADANRLFRETSLSPYFATLVCARAAAGGEIDVCNAGHPPPLVLGDDGVEMLAPTGFPLGAFYAANYRSTRLSLRPGQSVVLYTDGVTEARDRGGREYGLERLMEVARDSRALPPPEAVSQCLAHLAEFLGGMPRTDDVTFMVIRRTV